MKRFLLALIALWPAAAFGQPSCPSGGPLLVRNNFAEIAACGTGAQAAARAALGLAGVPTAVPNAPLLGGAGGAFTIITPGQPNTLATLDNNGLVPLAQLPAFSITVPTAPFLTGAGGSLNPGSLGAGLTGGGLSPLSVIYGTGAGTALQGSLLGASNGVAPLDGSALVSLANLPTIPASQTSGLLPLTGGTVPGTTNFTGAFQIGGTAQTFPMSGALVGLSDTQTLLNKTLNGATLAGTLSGTPTFAGPLNTAAALGFQQNGLTLITGGTNAAAPVTLCGRGAGASINLATAAWDVYCGFQSGNAFIGTSGENSGYGSVSLLLNLTGVQNTVVGSRVGGSFTADNEFTCGGDDAGRNVVGVSGATCWGEGSMRSGGSSGGVTGSSAFGFWSLRGNSGSVVVSGTKTTGDVITLTFTFNGSLPYTLPGSPVAVTYTVLSGDTLATITTGLIAAINANASLSAASPVQVTAFNTDPINPDAFGVDFAGTATTGAKIVMTASVSGSATETITIGGGNSGVDVIALGDEACLYSIATTATQNLCAGKLSLAEQTVGNEDVALGPFTGEFLSGANDTQNLLAGYGAGTGVLGLTSYFKMTLLGAFAGNGFKAASGTTVVGWSGCLLCSTASNGIYIGANVETGVTATASQQVVVGVSVAAPNINFAVNFDNVLAGLGNGATNPSVCATGVQCILGVLRGANLNSTADQQIFIAPFGSAFGQFLPSATKYAITGIFVDNCSTSTTTAVGGVYQNTGKTGPIVANTQAYTGCVSATTMQTLTLGAAPTTTTYTGTGIFLSLTTPQGTADTGDVYVVGIPYN